MTNTQSQILQATRLLAMEITLLAPYSLAPLPPSGCNGCLSGPLEPQGPSEEDRIPLSLPFFPGWGRCSRTPTRGRTSLVARTGTELCPGAPGAGWRGRTGRTSPEQSWTGGRWGRGAAPGGRGTVAERRAGGRGLREAARPGQAMPLRPAGGSQLAAAPLPGLSKPLSAALRAPHRRRLELHKSAL